MNWYKISITSSFLPELNFLRTEMALAAQSIYDSWEQNNDGIDEERGSGGICDAIANELGSIIAQHIPNVDVIDGGQDGDDHAFVIVRRGQEAYSVDIPPGYYESGGGYSWKKITDVTFSPKDIEIFKIDARYLEE